MYKSRPRCYKIGTKKGKNPWQIRGFCFFIERILFAYGVETDTIKHEQFF
ncbi:hypothetical protein BAXH7_01640 [Bacillus amyloliquefaciens XH7]|jgi:hypothetical protein|nr:hypothetical protein BAXH7_01640 [Bacillus amyloliquefaciens XH7]